MFEPKFQITPRTATALMDIEVSRRAVEGLPVSVGLLASLRESARLSSTHYSTQIEGNRLTGKEVAAVAKGGTFPNRKRDEKEVKNYFLALDWVDEIVGNASDKVTAEMIQQIHGLVMDGKRSPSEYRDGQNVIRESGSGNIIYMPPEWKEVPQLMDEMVAWINVQLSEKELPVPVVAGMAHYQFATIHPYYDGNGRTARLLTNLILHRAGYGLKGIYSLEEYYARNLEGYYGAISVGDSHNYYMGRVEADVSQWVEYFTQGMAESFAAVRSQAENLRESSDQTSLLRELDARQKLIIGLFRKSRFLTTREIAEALGVSSRMALNVCQVWVGEGFVVASGANKNRRYELGEKWVRLL